MIKAEYIDHMGDDLRVVNAARVSFDKESEWEKSDYFLMDGPSLPSKDKKLIRFLALGYSTGEWKAIIEELSKLDDYSEIEAILRSVKNHAEHWTPFSHVMVTMRETVPIFVARQRFKHMVGFTYNEVSRRYVDAPPEFYTPDAWRKKAENVKQGSSEEEVDVEPYEYILENNSSHFINYTHFLFLAERLYNSLLLQGVSPEQARMVLPQSMMTSYYVTGSLAAWARAYKQRIDPHAQKEIRDLAVQWGEIIEPLFPVSWKALTY